MLKGKCQETLEFVIELLGSYRKPMLMCSFGKDSMVLLHLLLSCGITLPIVLYADPWFPEKYKFARDVIADWGLEVHSYPPASCAISYGERESKVELVSMYSVGSGTVIALPKYLEEPVEGKRWLCGVDFLCQPKSTFEYPWDVALIGHKSADEDGFYGHVKLHTRLLQREKGPAYAYPLIDWTDEDVWNYTEEHKVPIQTDRYDVVNKGEHADKTYNSDHLSTCVKCIHKKFEGEQVECPKTGKKIPNVSEKVNVFTWKPDYFG